MADARWQRVIGWPSRPAAHKYEEELQEEQLDSARDSRPAAAAAGGTARVATGALRSAPAPATKEIEGRTARHRERNPRAQ